MNYYNAEKMMITLSGNDLLFGGDEWWAETEDGRPYLNIPISCHFDVKKVLGVDIRGDNDTVLEMSLCLYMDNMEAKVDMWLDGSEYKTPAYILFDLAEGSSAAIVEGAKQAVKENYNMSLDTFFALKCADTEEAVILLDNVIIEIHCTDGGSDYTIYDSRGNELDGGFFDGPDTLLYRAFAEIRTWSSATANNYAQVLPLSQDELTDLIEEGELAKYLERLKSNPVD